MEESGRSPAFSRIPRALVRAAAAVVILFAAVWTLHAAAIDELLARRRLVPLACRHPERLLFGWERAESPYPGRVRLVNVWFRGRGRSDEWWFRLREASFRFSPLELFSSRFHVTSLVANGVSFRRRLRREPGAAGAALAEVLPPIPGFPSVPVAGVPPYEPPPPGKRFWTVAIDRLALDDVSEIWMDTIRFEGAARVTGGFLLHPHDRAQVSPTTVDVSGGRVTLEGRRLADAVTGRVAARIDEFDIPAVHAKRASVWDGITGAARLRASSAGLPAVRRLLPRSVRLDARNATLSARLQAARGGIVRGEVALDLAGLSGSVPRLTVDGRLSARADVRSFSVRSQELSLGPASVELREAALHGAAEASAWWARLATPGLRYAPGSGIRAPVKLESRDAVPVVALVAPRAPRLVRKLLALPNLLATARVRLSPGRVEVERLDAEGEGTRVTGRYERRGQAKDGALLFQRGRLAVAVGWEGSRSKLHLLGARRWFAVHAGAPEMPAAGRTK